MRLEKIYLLLIFPVISSILISCESPFSDKNEIKKGEFRQTIVETGELGAVDTRSFILAQIEGYWNMKIIGLLEQGTEVEAGDSVIQLDPTVLRKNIIDQESSLQVQEANLEKLLVNQSNMRIELESNLKLAEASFNLQKLSMESSKFETENIQKVKKLQFEQEKIKLEMVKRKIILNKAVESNELKVQNIMVKQIKNDLKNSKALLPTFTIRTPISGIFQLAKNYEGNFVKIGDDIWPGSNMGNVPNLEKMKVNTTISENDFFKIEEGQKVIVRLDATPDVTFKGEITSIAKLCHLKDQKSRLKVFDVEVNVLKSDERLKPGMTVSCEFVCKDLKNATFVSLNCVETTDEGSFIYLKQKNGYLRTKVKTGASNNTNIIIKGDYQKGQDIIPIDQIEKHKEEK